MRLRCVFASLLTVWLLACGRPTGSSHVPEPLRDRGAIQGIVRDEYYREALVGARVFLHCSCLVASRETRADARGVFRFTDLPPGHYAVEVRYKAGGVGHETFDLAPAERLTLPTIAVDRDGISNIPGLLLSLRPRPIATNTSRIASCIVTSPAAQNRIPKP